MQPHEKIWLGVAVFCCLVFFAASVVLFYIAYTQRRTIARLRKKNEKLMAASKLSDSLREKEKREQSSRQSSSKTSKRSPTSGRATPKALKPSTQENNNNSLSESKREVKEAYLDVSNALDNLICVSKRKPIDRVKEPMTPAEFILAMSQTIKVMVDYYTNPEQFKVTTSYKTNQIIGMMPKEAPLLPQDFKDILGDLRRIIMPGMTHWQHPRFLAYFPSGRCFPDIIGDAIVATLGVVGFSYDSCPALTEMEVVTSNWLGKIFGLPPGFLYTDDPASSPGGGCCLPTASDAVFCAVMAARDWKINRIMDKHQLRMAEQLTATTKHLSKNYDLAHEICGKLVVYTSKDAHSCLEKACKMAMVRCRPIQATAENDYGITGTQLEEAVIKDIEAGLIPMHVHVTLGTTSTAAHDHLDTIWPIARKYKMWLHVDAAYAGSTWVDPRHREQAKGLQHVTSININLNKFFMHTTPGAMVWTQDQRTFKKAFDICPTYLKPMKDDTMDLRHFGVQLSRTFRSIKIWSVLRVYGVEGMKNYVNTMIDHAIFMESLLVKHPNVRLFGKRNFTLFCFQYVEPGMTKEEISKATLNLANYINESHEIFLTRSNVDGNDIIRISVNYPKNIEDTALALCQLIDQYRERRDQHLRIPSPNVAVLPGRNVKFGKGIMDIDLAGTPVPEVQSGTVQQWAETPMPITQQESLKEVKQYRLPHSPAIKEALDAQKYLKEAVVQKSAESQIADKIKSKSQSSLHPSSAAVSQPVVVSLLPAEVAAPTPAVMNASSSSISAAPSPAVNVDKKKSKESVEPKKE